MISETFFDLLRDPAHWGFELFVIAIFDVLIGIIIWPRVKRHFHRDVLHAELHTAFQETDPADDVHVRVAVPAPEPETKMEPMTEPGCDCDMTDDEALYLLMWAAGVSLPPPPREQCCEGDMMGGDLCADCPRRDSKEDS